MVGPLWPSRFTSTIAHRLSRPLKRRELRRLPDRALGRLAVSEQGRRRGPCAALDACAPTPCRPRRRAPGRASRSRRAPTARAASDVPRAGCRRRRSVSRSSSIAPASLAPPTGSAPRGPSRARTRRRRVPLGSLGSKRISSKNSTEMSSAARHAARRMARAGLGRRLERMAAQLLRHLGQLCVASGHGRLVLSCRDRRCRSRRRGSRGTASVFPAGATGQAGHFVGQGRAGTRVLRDWRRDFKEVT